MKSGEPRTIDVESVADLRASAEETIRGWDGVPLPNRMARNMANNECEQARLTIALCDYWAEHSTR